jgi:hypothetical protein
MAGAPAGAAEEEELTLEQAAQRAFALTIEGFSASAAAKTAAQAPAAKPAAAPVQQAAPAPQVEEGIPGDVVAAIMAAIHAMGNGKYTLKAVRRGKNGWGKAGVNDTTAPF